MNLHEFGQLNRERARSMKTDTSARLSQIVLAMVSRLVVDTPVDTGKAKSGWTVTNGRPGSPYSSLLLIKGEKGSTADANIQAVLRAAKAALRAHSKGQSIWISNDVHYIEKLNTGSSTQHPGGFVQDAVTLGHYMARQK